LPLPTKLGSTPVSLDVFEALLDENAFRTGLSRGHPTYAGNVLRSAGFLRFGFTSGFSKVENVVTEARVSPPAPSASPAAGAKSS
jgi:hypothetical protein